MNGDSGATPAFDLRAVGSGALWGLLVMVIGAIVQGLLGFRSPLSAGTEDLMAMIWQALGSLVGGYLAARRAPGAGWLHGLLSGLALLLGQTAVASGLTDLPGWAAMAKAAGICSGAGALGGIAGVNMKG